MGVRKKGRRRITICGRSFLWYVAANDPFSLDLVLHVASTDKKLILHYHLAQQGEPILVVVGPEFRGLIDPVGHRRRFHCPKWDSDGKVKPGDVRRLIEWCLTTGDRPPELKVW
jgi:hypothetical protein